MNYKGLSEEKHIEIIEKQASRIAYLEFELEQLKRALFGSKSERFISNAGDGQLNLFTNEPQEETPVETTTVASHTKKKQKPKRKKLPAHLERRVEIIEPEIDTTDMRYIGEEVTEKLEVVPAKLFVRQMKRPKYVDKVGKIYIAPVPSEPFPKCIAGASLAAQVLISKFVDSLPLYRQAKIFKRSDIDLPTSTLNDIVARTFRLLLPLLIAHEKIILEQEYIMADESSIRVLTKNNEKGSIKGCMLIIAAPILNLVLMKYIKTKEKDNIVNSLKSILGHLQADGYTVYEALGKLDAIILMHCMAHARRKFEKALDYHKEKAEIALNFIAQLYAIERKIKEFSVDEKYQIRQEQAIPILNKYKQWLEGNLADKKPMNPMQRAIRYTLKRWSGLTEYTKNGNFQIDTNYLEREVRPLALGRKNYLFAGSHNGAHYAALFYSLFATCRLNGIEPFKWLTYVLEKIQDHPINKIEELLPHPGFSYS